MWIFPIGHFLRHFSGPLCADSRPIYSPKESLQGGGVSCLISFRAGSIFDFTTGTILSKYLYSFEFLYVDLITKRTLFHPISSW